MGVHILKQCDIISVSVPGLWKEWSPWSLCSTTCGGGLRYRNRTCDMDSFGNLTIDCEGSSDDYLDCHTFSCTPLGKQILSWNLYGHIY